MEEIKVILRKNVTDFLEELVFILFEKEYFGFEDNEQDYVQKIYDFIEFNLPNFHPKNTPENLIDLVQSQPKHHLVYFLRKFRQPIFGHLDYE